MSDTPFSGPEETSGKANPYSHPQQNPYVHSPDKEGALGMGGHESGAEQGDGTGGVIPYKNPKALIAYYCAIFGLLPIIGLPFAIAAFVLGILGLKARKQNPIIRGSVHAWIGIVLGGLECAFNFAAIGLTIFGLFVS